MKQRPRGAPAFAGKMRNNPGTPRLSLIRVDPLGLGLHNMDMDNSMFEAFRVGQYGDGAVVRMYGWVANTISLGRFQESGPLASSVMDVVHRPTGGRAVVHTPDEVTYTVIGGLRAGFPVGLHPSYEMVSRLLVGAFARIGMDVHTADTSIYHHRADCFGSATCSDLTVGGKKVCGGAQRRVGDDFLQHGTILVTEDQRMAQGFISHEDAVSGTTSIEEVIGRVSREDVIGAIYAEASCMWSPCRL